MIDSTFKIEDMYKKKKNLAAQRGIDFLFTLDEYAAFYALRDTERCFYTNSNFNLEKRGGIILPNNYPTTERIDQSKPYSKENCVWVTLNSNKVKARFIEQQESIKGQSAKSGNIRILNKIKKVLANPVAMESKMQPYWDAYADVRSKNIASVSGKQTDTYTLKPLKSAPIIKGLALEEVTDNTQEESYIHKDVDTAENYVRLGRFVRTMTSFDLTFSQYKRKFDCKKDKLTGLPFTEDDKKCLYWVDKQKPFSVNNTIITTVQLQTALDVFTASAKLNLTSLQSLCKVLSNYEVK